MTEELWSQGRVGLVEEIYSPTFVCHFLTGPDWEGLEGITKEVSSHRTSYPDWNERIIKLVAEGDYVVAHFAATGTHKGDLHGIPPTGKRVNVHEVAIVRIENGKIAEQWGFPDLLGVSQQLGVTGPPTNRPSE
jgi:steroid delta-isomerase-like uncharacterized protein